MEKEELFDIVWQTWQKEKQSSKLQVLPKSFYEDATKSVQGSQMLPEQQKAARENLQKVLASIYEKRKQKILTYVAYAQPVPSQLPQIELEFYKKVENLFDLEKLHLADNGTEDHLFVIQPIPKIVLPSGREIGPLGKDEAVEIDVEQDRNFLISNSICRKA